MDFGFSLGGINPRNYPAVAAKAEACGFTVAWQPEHLIWPAAMPPQYPYSADGLPGVTIKTPSFDAWVNLALCASTTTRLRLGSAVYILPLRHPLITARSVATLDFISRGRAILGIGVGWLEEEFALAGQDWHSRGARTDEIIQILKTLWTNDIAEHHGKHYDIAPVSFQPKPVAKPHAPILVGGDSPAAIKRAAKLGDGWIAIGEGAEAEFAERVKQLRAIREECGRGGEPMEIVTNAKSATVEEVRRLAEQGATCVNLPLGNQTGGGSPSVDQLGGVMEELAEKVISKF